MNALSTAGSRFRDIRVVAGLVVAAVIATVLVGVVASARSGQAHAEAGGDAPIPTVSCPGVVDRLPAVPAQASADVEKELGALQTQITAANNRLASSVGEGGPNFISNAILGPLRDKRVATLERIEISIGRHAERPTGLVDLAECSLSEDGAGGEDDAGDGNGNGDGGGAADPGDDSDGAGDADGNGSDGNGSDDAGGAAPPPAGALAVDCPSVEDQLPAVPAQASADVEKELGALQTQITEANNRLASSAGEGGPNFANNAILGPLKDKRVATLERIEISIGRHAERPTGLVDLATCTLNG